MRKVLIGLLVLVVAAVAAALGLGPMFAEQAMNKVVGGPWPVSAEAAALHKKLTIVDLHSDTLLWQRPVERLATRGHVDLPRLEAGNVALQVFSSVTKTPKGQNYTSNSGDTDNITLLAIAQAQPVRTWNSLLERSLWHAEKLNAAAQRAEGRLLVIRTPADLDRLLKARAAGHLETGALLSTEGAQDLEGRLSNIDVLYAAGFRMMGLAHFFDNEIAGSMHGVQKYGLTPLGRQAVAAMEKKGIIVDVAHSSHKAFADVLAVATRPVVVSHGGVKATCNTNRNLTDDELRALAANGGMIGIGYWDAAVCAATPDATAKAILHAVRVAGIDHVGLGSDFDGATTTGLDAAHVSAITDALLRAGMGEADIAKVMGGNALRIIAAGLRPR